MAITSKIIGHMTLCFIRMVDLFTFMAGNTPVGEKKKNTNVENYFLMSYFSAYVSWYQ